MCCRSAGSSLPDFQQAFSFRPPTDSAIHKPVSGIVSYTAQGIKEGKKDFYRINRIFYISSEIFFNPVNPVKKTDQLDALSRVRARPITMR